MYTSCFTHHVRITREKKEHFFFLKRIHYVVIYIRALHCTSHETINEAITSSFILYPIVPLRWLKVVPCFSPSLCEFRNRYGNNVICICKKVCLSSSVTCSQMIYELRLYLFPFILPSRSRVPYFPKDTTPQEYWYFTTPYILWDFHLLDIVALFDCERVFYCSNNVWDRLGSHV